MRNILSTKPMNTLPLTVLFITLAVALLISGCQSAENKAAVAEMKQRLSNEANSAGFDASLEKINFLGMMAVTWSQEEQATLARLLVAADKNGVDIAEGFNSLGYIKSESLSKRAGLLLSHGELTEDQLVTLITSKAGRLSIAEYDANFYYKNDVETLAKEAKLIKNWGPEKFDEVAGLS